MQASETRLPVALPIALPVASSVPAQSFELEVAGEHQNPQAVAEVTAQANGARAFERQRSSRRSLAIPSCNSIAYPLCMIAGACALGSVFLLMSSMFVELASQGRNENNGHKQGLGTETRTQLANQASAAFEKIVSSLAKNASAHFRVAPQEFSACLENHAKRPNFDCDTAYYSLPANQTSWGVDDLKNLIHQMFERLKNAGVAMESIRPANTDVGEFNLVAIYNRLNTLIHETAKPVYLHKVATYMAMAAGGYLGCMALFFCCVLPWFD